MNSSLQNCGSFAINLTTILFQPSENKTPAVRRYFLRCHIGAVFPLAKMRIAHLAARYKETGAFVWAPAFFNCAKPVAGASLSGFVTHKGALWSIDMGADIGICAEVFSAPLMPFLWQFTFRLKFRCDVAMLGVVWHTPFLGYGFGVPVLNTITSFCKGARKFEFT